MIYKFKSKDGGDSVELESVREKATITFFGLTEDSGIELEAEELQKFINALNSIQAEIRDYSKEVEK